MEPDRDVENRSNDTINTCEIKEAREGICASFCVELNTHLNLSPGISLIHFYKVVPIVYYKAENLLLVKKN